MVHAHNSEPNAAQAESQDELNKELQKSSIPAHLIVAEFGEVNVWRYPIATKDAKCRVDFTIAMEPQGKFAEGWRTGLALDASASMKRVYGRKVEVRVDPELLTTYIKQGRLKSYLEDGEPIRKIQREAFAEIKERGYAVKFTENILQPLVQDFIAYLANGLDETGKTALIYWGCGQGDEIQVLGEFDALSCQQLAITGSNVLQLGKTTHLLPAIAYFVNQYSQAQRGIYLFLTDGRIDDLEDVKEFTKELATDIANGNRNYLKLILIAIGNDIDRYQLQELDSFDTGCDVDIWDYKIASEMTSLSQIFAEVISENQIIAENAAIYDDMGNCVKIYPNGFPSKVDFVMRHDSQWFELEVNQQRIRQTVTLTEETAIAPLPKKSLFDFELQAQAPDATIASEYSPSGNLSSTWRILAALLIGGAFIGTAIAFGILIQRSDQRKILNQPIPNEIKKPVTK